MTAPLFNRDVLLPGMILSRMTPHWISRAIVLRTQGLRVLLAGSGLSHDAILIRTGDAWFAGDALMGKLASLTPIEDWEDDMRERGVRVVVSRPLDTTPRQMAAAAWFWQTEISGQVLYDQKAIVDLAWRWLAERCGHKLGDEDRLYCTESCQLAYREGACVDPWRKLDGARKWNPTPGTTRKRIVGKNGWRTLAEVPNALTEAGRRYAINLSR
jgi:hypothetical protein